MPQARIILPGVADVDLQRLLENALSGNQRRFTEMLTQVKPSANAGSTFTSFSEVVNLNREVDIHAGRYAIADATNDRRGVNLELDEMQRLRRTGELRGYVNIGVTITSTANDKVVEYGREHHRSEEDINTSRGDLARALLEHGFSLSDVMPVFGDLAGVGAQSENESESALAFQAMMRDAAVAHSEKMRRDMRDIQDRMNSTTDVQKKRQLEEDYRMLLQEYNRLIGGAMGSMADQFARGGEATETTPSGRSITVDEQRMEGMARDQATLLIRAHMHKPGDYVPVRVRQAQ